MKNMIDYINIKKGKYNLIILIDSEQSFEKNSTSFHDEKTKNHVEGMYFNTIKAICHKYTADITFISKQMKFFF
jgi:hypothetical protein